MLKERLQEYSKTIKECCDAGFLAGEYLTSLLRPVIPDIEFSLGWEEAGVDTLCLWALSRTENVSGPNYSDEYTIDLIGLLLEFIDDVFIRIDAPFGIYLSKEEAEIIRKIFEEEFKETA
ncbi:MAG: hypothetical protein N2578_00740 [Bdellovibrionaceae bacterium]|nr:hypothetical protein [Pseudobdellovibrionaceae bacterium]